MIKNPLHVYGPKGLNVPSNLNFGEYILENMWQYGDNVAMINGETDERITYREIAQQAMNFAVSLTRMGVGKGQTVALFSENRKEYWSAVVGVVCTGAALTTLNTGYTKGEIKYATSISNPTVIICSPTTYKNNERTIKSISCIEKIILFGNEERYNTLFYNVMAVNVENNVIYEQFEAVPVTGQTDTLFILYSSGTTGLPKGVMLTHLNVLTACSMHVSFNPKELSLTITPWYHVMGLVGTLTGLSKGRTGVYLPKFNVDLYLKTIEKYKISQLTVVPPVLVAVCKSQAQHDLSSVRIIYSGAAPLHRDTIQAVKKKFPNIPGVLQGYGATELTLGVIKINFDDERILKPGSVGSVVPSMILKVVDTETRKPLGPNQQGELCMKGELVMKGYLGKSRNEDFDDEGFYKSGDIGYYDEDRIFFIVDRLKELIKYKGYQVPPAELEAVILQHPGVRDVGVVGVAHKEAGEVPLAFVVVQPGETVTEEELKEFVADRLSNPKHLRGGVQFVDQIPKSASGKILRQELKKVADSRKSKL